MPQNIPIATDLESLIDDETSSAQLWLRPLGLLVGKVAAMAVERELALPLAGGTKASAAAGLLARRRGRGGAPAPAARLGGETEHAGQDAHRPAVDGAVGQAPALGRVRARPAGDHGNIERDAGQFFGWGGIRRF